MEAIGNAINKVKNFAIWQADFVEDHPWLASGALWAVTVALMVALVF